MRHEGWSYEVDVYDHNKIANDPIDPWSANCAIPELIFEQPDKFRETFPELKLVKNTLNESLIFPLSGGVIAKSKMIKLPYSLLSLVSRLDDLLIKVAPKIFALGRSVAIQRT